MLARMKLFVTVLEETCDAAVRAIRAIALPTRRVEVRAEKFPSIDLRCAARGDDEADHPHVSRLARRRMSRAHWTRDRFRRRRVARGRRRSTIPTRTVISHHDYEGMRDVETIMAKMRALGCAYTKLAATPHDLRGQRASAEAAAGHGRSGWASAACTRASSRRSAARSSTFVAGEQHRRAGAAHARARARDLRRRGQRAEQSLRDRRQSRGAQSLAGDSQPPVSREERSGRVHDRVDRALRRDHGRVPARRAVRPQRHRRRSRKTRSRLRERTRGERAARARGEHARERRTDR